jgi:hypothetical protein
MKLPVCSGGPDFMLFAPADRRWARPERERRPGRRELSVAEQRYRAVMEAGAGVPVTEVAERYEVSRQSVTAGQPRTVEVSGTCTREAGLDGALGKDSRGASWKDGQDRASPRTTVTAHSNDPGLSALHRRIKLL